jgi:superfamily I DNA and/or RNA helicase/very-short-patch-repair endonuclease
MKVEVSTNNDLLQAKIEKWKRDLIDLTNRNVLLNFRPKKNNSLQLFEEPQVLFDDLVKNSKNLNMEELQTTFLNQIQKIMDSEEEEQVKRKRIGEEKERFVKLVGKLRLDARTRLNEQGIQTLYLVFGVLKWKEQGSGKEFMSPLLLIPVDLNRSSANQPFRIKMVDDEIVLNPFMAHKLREEKGVIFPELGDQEDVELQKIWSEISEKIDYLEGWSVSPDLYLSLFSFSKLVMYKDLENYRELLESHPLIRTISGVESDDNVDLMDLSSVPDESNLDRIVPSEESYQVLDADSSQQQAVIAAKNGVSFVLQGPPGTGKSQTISNIIAECLAANKKVLFVSEKMAALEVVKSRLEHVGLGEFCLELHSHKANKRSVLNSFQEVMDKHPKRKQIKNELYSNINLLREQLNTYSEKLHQIREPFGKSVYEIHGFLAKLDEIQEMLFDFDINESTDFEHILSLLNDLERYRNQMILGEHTPIWKGFTKLVYSLELASKMESLLQALLENIYELIQSDQTVQKTLGLRSNSIEDIRQNQTIIEMAKYSPNPPKHWFEHKSIQTTIQKAKQYQEKMSSFLEEKKSLSQLFKLEILKNDLPKIYDGLFAQSRNLFKSFDSNDPIVLVQERDFIEETVEQGRRSLQSMENLQSVQDEFGLPLMKKIEDVRLLHLFMSILLKKPRPTKQWFHDLEGVQKSIQEAKERFLNWEQRRDLVQQKYEPSLLELDLFTLRQMIETQGAELFPLFSSSNQSDSKGDEVFSKQLSIQDRIEKFLALQQQFEQVQSFVSQSLDIELSHIKSVINLKPMMELLSKDLRPTPSWFQTERQHDIYSFIQESKNVQKKYQQELSATLELYEEEVLDERIFDMLERFETTYQSPLRIFNGSFNRDRKWLSSKLKQKMKYDFDSLFKHVRSAKRVLEHKKWMDEKQADFRSYFGRHYRGYETAWNSIEESFYALQEIQQMFPDSKVPAPLKEILIQSAGRLEHLISEYERMNSISTEMKEVLQSLKGDFPSLFFKWSAQPIEQWSILEVTNELKELQLKLKAFYANTQQLLDIRKPGTVSHLSLQDLLQDIDLALSMVELKNQITTYEPQIKEVMGTWYQQEQTRWEHVEQALSDVKMLQASTSFIPEKFQSLLMEDSFTIGDSYNELERALQKLEHTINVLMEKVPRLFDDCHSTEVDKWNISHLMNRIDWLYEKLQHWYQEYDLIGQFIMLEYQSTVELKKDLEQAILVKEQQNLLDAELDSLKETFGDFFSGYTTNWDIIFDALAWLEEWMQHFSHQDVPKPLLSYVSEGSTPERKQELVSLFEKNAELLKQNDQLYRELGSYFAEDALQEEGESLQKCSFSHYLSWLNKRVQSMEQLEEWIRYQRLEKKIKDVQLSSFIEHLEKERPSKGSFSELFQKRFYRKWLDNIYQEEEILYDFDAERANETILNFCESDLKSLDQNAERVQEILEKKRQHAIDSLTYRQELGVILHEIGKKKRHIAIRKLLSQTSALALEIKPCFLMSPLSVSQYLDANDITFDVVIFDEASQIFPEDAIGSIIRASQVIIVGDNKQLPPTDFFKAGGSGEEFEDENEVDYESILDECMYVLPNMRLRWHYRSRHESLISFSNTAFYSNSLITFPSAEHGDDLGVKFVHVPDGIYDRGGTRSNKREAEVTAQLVFEHFRKSPDRSLGVIAFSDAQATEIREQIDLLRRKNPSMEQFFKEDQQDEFFVKSLENVQGDERDAIFFSIGYGRAPDGNLHMNFGPLSKNGGERRLNVAVTRAKYHIKLISSLLPQDIPLERTQSIGVHRLRDYMEMARSGHLPTYSSSDNIKIFDSPFEEDVYEVLADMGYEVHTQVGASGYKIDLAVVDPRRPDSYLCGIECDGKTYHSSKIARDRDRLRQQVLENLGWKIHRIWSQEWFKKRKFEITRLKNLLGKLEGE